MVKHYDQTKHHRGSSLPKQEPGEESDKELAEWVRGLKSAGACRDGQAHAGASETGSDANGSDDDSHWQDEGGEA